MIGDTHDGHNGQNQTQHRNVDRDEKDQRGDDYRAAYRFHWVKTHRRPSGWRTAIMMNSMGDPEPIGPMEQSVGPVKPAVMEQ